MLHNPSTILKHQTDLNIKENSIPLYIHGFQTSYFQVYSFITLKKDDYILCKMMKANQTFSSENLILN